MALLVMSLFSFEKILQILDAVISILRFALKSFYPSVEDEKENV